MVSTLARIWRKVSQATPPETESVEHSAESVEKQASSSDEGETESAGPLGDYDPSALCSRRHFVTEMGISHDEFFSRLLEEQGGSLRQKEFAEFTSLSSSTISRILQEMEDDEQVVRVQIGRENIVYLPEHAPAGSVSRTDSADIRLHA